MKNPKKEIETLTSVIKDEQKEHGLIGLGDFNNLVAQKTGPMREINSAMIVDPSDPKKELGLMPRQSLILSMLYLGKINSNDPNKYYVFIPISELKLAFGRDELKKDEVLRWLTYLQSPCRLKNESKYRTVNFFTDSEILYSEKCRMIGIRLACSSYAKEFIFNLGENEHRYIKVLVSWAIRLKSRYSFVLLDHIIDEYFSVWGTENGNICSWSVTVDELREILMTPDNYSWNDMNEFVLKPSIKEINENTGYRLTLKKNSYSHVESITINITKNYDPETIVEDVESKYPDIDSFKNYSDYIAYYNGLTADRKAEYDAVIQTRNANTYGVDSTIRTLKECLKLDYTNNQLMYISRLINRFIKYEARDHEYDEDYQFPTLADMIDVLQGYEEKASYSSHKEHKYSEHVFVISCFEHYLGL